MDPTAQDILRRRMHNLYLTRSCPSLKELSRQLMGLHCWFHRNVAFSALIRGAALTGWKTALTKTWLYRGTLHGVAYDDLPNLLALHAGDGEDNWRKWIGLSEEAYQALIREVISLMEDGVYSRAEMRTIFAERYDSELLSRIFSPWGGIFVSLARQGRVAFRSMTSRDFDLISAEPTQTRAEALPDLLRRFFAAYGPATLADAQWFFGLEKADLMGLDLDEFKVLDHNGEPHYYLDSGEDPADIPHLTLLSGFDPYVVSYVDRQAVLPREHRAKVILKSGICLPTVAIDGQVAGVWNIKKNEPVVEFFTRQPKSIINQTYDLVDTLRWQTSGQL